MSLPFRESEPFTELQEVADVALREVAADMLAQLRRSKGVPKRFRRYVDDPVGFFRDVLKVEPWSRQAELIDAAGRHDRVLCRSGHKCGKSLTCVGLALWWICTRPGARVLLTAPTFRQVKDILWHELARWYPAVQGALDGEDMPLDPATGIRLPNGGQIVGVSTSKKENLAGYSGANQLFIVDEASGFPDELYVTLKGNSAGGSKIIAISNPTRTVGWFYQGFKSGTYDLRPANENGIAPHRWRLLHISSEESPNIAANDNGRPLIPGLALPSYIDEMRDECGPDWETNADYLVRVRGEFPAEGTDAVVGLGILNSAHARWTSAVPSPPGDLSVLTIGVDVARFGNDDTVLSPVRGAYAFTATALRKADGPAIAEAVVRLARTLRRPNERVRVCVDGVGVGASVVDALRHHDAVAEGVLYVVDVQAGAGADDEHHANLRTQLWFGLRAWLAEGGTLPEDDELDSEILAHTYSFNPKGQKQVVSKKVIRAVLGRSPDRADALALALYRGAGVTYDIGAVPSVRDLEEARDDRSKDEGRWMPRGRAGVL